MLYNVGEIVRRSAWATDDLTKWHYLIHSWKYKRVYIFPEGISPKVNVIARLEFELAYNNVTA